MAIHKIRKTHLRFPQNLAARADPGNEDEFLTLRLFVVRVSNTGVGVGSLSSIQFLLKFSQATSACSCDDQFIRAVALQSGKVS
jgi:hypothetical protein